MFIIDIHQCRDDYKITRVNNYIFGCNADMWYTVSPQEQQQHSILMIQILKVLLSSTNMEEFIK